MACLSSGHPCREERLIEFIEQINSEHPKIQFTTKWSNRSIAFLDVKVTLDKGHLTTDLVTTPTDTHQYLHKLSCHPAHLHVSPPSHIARHCVYGDHVQMATLV